jgi:hypothetical protein
MQFKAVGRVTMCHHRFKVRRQVNDADGVERAFLGANTATDTETFGNEGYAGFVGDFDAELAGSDNGAGFLALLTTFLSRVSRRICCDVIVLGYLGFALYW